VLLGLLILVFVLGRSIVGWFLETRASRRGPSVADEAHDWLVSGAPSD